MNKKVRQVTKTKIDALQDYRLDVIEKRIEKHDLLLETLIDSQNTMQNNFTELTTTLTIHNDLLSSAMSLLKKLSGTFIGVFALGITIMGALL